MGKGVIVEHLGDAHYRIVLDIDVSYARNALYGLQTYLAEFAPKYAEALQKKDDALAALTPINDRLTEYLKAGQEASQAAYDAMVAAYEAYADAVQTLPDQAAAAALRDASDEEAGNFTSAPSEETGAITIGADADWQFFVGEFLDPDAVSAATDAKNAAVSDLITAQEQFDRGELPEQALKFFQQNYADLRADWVTAVDDNSGPQRVARLQKDWADATDAFNKAREDLGKLLDNGGMPEALAKIMADQEKAYADYHAALANWVDMLMVKTEKEKQAAELQSRLIAYTDNDGNPIRQEVNAWCCDFTEDLAEGAEVATIEIPGERDLAVRVRPGYESRETYAAERDGILQPSWAGSPEQTYWNWALHPGNARWHPNYRLGEILLIDPQAGTCTVQLDQQTNNAKSRARDGSVLDVNNPIKYQIDSFSGEQIAILPGENIQVSGGVTTLTNVPVEYMECNAEAFQVGDRVMVEFQGRDWTQAKVIGFAESPRPCVISGIMCDARVNGAGEVVQYRGSPGATYDNSKYKFFHLADETTGGNIDWTSTDRRNSLTWHGPLGRTLTSRFWHAWYDYELDTYQPFSPYSGVNLIQDWQLYETRYDVPAAPELSAPLHANAKGGFYFLSKFKEWIYRKGQFFAKAPLGHLVLGASISESVITEEGPDNGTIVRYLIAATALDSWEKFPLGNFESCTTLHIYAVDITQGITDPNEPNWQLIGAENLSGKFRLPPTHIVAFSGNGKRFATLWPKFRFPATWDVLTNADFGPFSLQDEHSIVRGEINHEGRDLSVAFTVEEQGGATWADPPPSKTAVIGVDYKGEDEVLLMADFTRDHTKLDIGDPFARYLSAIDMTITLMDSTGHMYCENHQRVSNMNYGLPLGRIDMKGDSVVDQPLFIDLRHNEMTRIHYEVTEDVQIIQVGGEDDVNDIRSRTIDAQMTVTAADGRIFHQAAYAITDTASFQRETPMDYGETIFNAHGPLTLYGGSSQPNPGDHLAALAYELCAPMFWQPAVDNNSVENELDAYQYNTVYTPIKTRSGWEKSIIDTRGNVIFNLVVPIGIAVPIITSDNNLVSGYSPWFAYPMVDASEQNLVSYPSIRAATQSNLEIDWSKHKTEQHPAPENDPPPPETFADATITPICLV